MSHYGPEYPSDYYPAAPLIQQGPPAKGFRGLAVSAFVLGVVSAAFGLIPLTFFIAVISGIIALVFGIVGRKHRMGKAGIFLGIVGIALGIWGAVIVNSAVNDVNKHLDNFDSFNSCMATANTLQQMDQC